MQITVVSGVAATNAGEDAVMCKNVAMTSLSVLFVAAFLRETNAQQIDVMPNDMDIRILAESVPRFDIGEGCRVDNMPSNPYRIGRTDKALHAG